MNTYRLDEDLEAVLGDGAAKSLVQTLGTTFEEPRDTVTRQDDRVLREAADDCGIFTNDDRFADWNGHDAVSYTHLTLPTKA